MILPIAYGFIILLFLALLVEVLSIALKVTGLDLEKARFQVISIITHTGFTTRESELITQHPTRRKIVQVLMLVSYVTTATFISIIISSLRSHQEFMFFSLLAATALVLIILLFRNKRVINRIEEIIEKQLVKQMKNHSKNKTVEEVLRLNDEYGVTEFIIDEKSLLVGLTLNNSGLKKNYIQVLNIDRGSHMVHFPKNDFIFQLGDKVVVYGLINSIEELIVSEKKILEKVDHHIKHRL